MSEQSLPAATSPAAGLDEPGSLSTPQWLAILAAYSGMGRAPLLAIGERAGRPVGSVMELSYREAERVLSGD